jgi:hypothetical protein
MQQRYKNFAFILAILKAGTSLPMQKEDIVPQTE